MKNMNCTKHIPFSKAIIVQEKKYTQKEALGRNWLVFRLLVPAKTSGKLWVPTVATGLPHPGGLKLQPLWPLITLKNWNHSFFGGKKIKVSLTLGHNQCNPQATAVINLRGWEAQVQMCQQRVEKGEAGKANSFDAGGKYLYNYISWTTPLAESWRVQGKP